MFGQIANIATQMMANIHYPGLSGVMLFMVINPMIGAALIGLLPSLWQILFGGGGNQETNPPTTQDTTTTTVTPPWQPKDPGYNILSPYLMSMFTQNFGRLSGAGYPGGKGIGGDMTQQLIDVISKGWPDILGSYNKPAFDPATNKDPALATTLADCIAACDRKNGQSSGFSACHDWCQNKFRGK